jgi:Tol biopolymer transport system component
VDTDVRASSPLSRGFVAVALAVLAGGCTYVTRASVDSTGGDPNGPSGTPSISGTGQYVAFVSSATDLVPGGACGIVARNVRSGQQQCATVDVNGLNSSGGSPSMSFSGRYVAFTSAANNLIPADGNPFADVFVRDLQNGTTTRVSETAAGGDAGSGSSLPAINGDARYVAFASGASNFVAGDANGTTDVYRKDRQTGAVTRVSVDSGGGDSNGLSTHPAISDDGRYVAFSSAASDLVAGDTNGIDDIFVRDLQAGTTVRVSVGNDVTFGPPDANSAPSISDDGTHVAFTSTWAASTGEIVFTNVFVRDVVNGTTIAVTSSSNEADSSDQASISGDARFLAFQSGASNLVPRDTNGVTDVFVRDLVTGTTTRASVDYLGGQADTGASTVPSMSHDGRYVAFTSTAADLVDDDGTTGANGADIFIRAVSTPTVSSVAPSSLARGATATLTLTGTGFFPGSAVSLTALGGPGVTVNSVTVVSETTIQVSATAAPDAPTGARTVAVFKPGTGPGPLAAGYGLCINCLTVT